MGRAGAVAMPSRDRNAPWRVRRLLKREDEFIEVGLEVLAAQPVIDGQT